MGGTAIGSGLDTTHNSHQNQQQANTMRDGNTLDAAP